MINNQQSTINNQQSTINNQQSLTPTPPVAFTKTTTINDDLFLLIENFGLMIINIKKIKKNSTDNNSNHQVNNTNTYNDNNNKQYWY